MKKHTEMELFEGFNYRLEFEDIKLGFSLVTVNYDQNTESQKYRVYVNDRDIGIRTEIEVPATVSDIIDLGIAVFVADRIIKSCTRERLRIHVVLPVRCPDRMNSDTVVHALRKVLAQYTEHTWYFAFKHRTEGERSGAWQQSLPLKTPGPVEVALWSGGLDAFAGFLNRLSDNPKNHFVLCGAGSNTAIHRQQCKLRDGVKQHYPSSTTLIRIRYEARKIEQPLPSRPLLRSRGFTFILLGAACAYLHGQQKLYIYENGPGAINLPFRQSELGLDHARAVHPLSLQYLSELLTAILDMPFELINPFLFKTKAQMCRIFKYSDLADLIADTITCDHIHRNTFGQVSRQCGRCSSCILRRQALAVVGITDQTRYAYEAFFPDNIEPVGKHDHLPAMICQIENLRNCLIVVSPWEELRHEYPTLSLDMIDRASGQIGQSPDKIRENLIELYQHYVFEWDMLKERSHEQQYLS